MHLRRPSSCTRSRQEKDKLGLGIDTSQVAVGIACTVTDNPLRLFAGQSLLAGIQQLLPGR